MPRFHKGQQPGPGRPRGSRNRSTVWFDEVGAQGIEKVIRVVADRAAEGDMRAAAIMLARSWPRRLGRPVALDLPDVTTAGGLVQAQAAVIAAMARGEVSPDEAAAIGAMLEHQRRAIETHDHERRIEELKKGAHGQDDPLAPLP